MCSSYFDVEFRIFAKKYRNDFFFLNVVYFSAVIYFLKSKISIIEFNPFHTVSFVFTSFNALELWLVQKALIGFIKKMFIVLLPYLY